MTAQDLFNSVKQFNTVSEIKDWAASIGYDFNPDYTGLDDENDHPNYQNFFNVEVLFAEIGDRTDGMFTIIYNQDGNEVLAQHEFENCYNDLITADNSHTVSAS
jgi:hypothetical protein